MSSPPAPAAIPRPVLPPPAADSLAGFGFVLVMALFFGAAPTFARLAFDGGTGALTLQFMRFTFAAAGLWTMLLVTGRVGRIGRRHLPLMAALVLVSGGASYGYMTSVRTIPVPVASLVFFTFPLLVGPLAHLIGDDRLTVRRVLALGVGFAGIALVLEGGIAHADPLGLALAFGAGMCVAVSFQITRRLTAEIPPMTLTATVAAVSAMAYVVFLILQGEFDLPASPRGWVGALGNGLAYMVGLTCLFAAIQRLGPVRTAVASNLEPVVSVAIAAVVLNEALSHVQLLGGLVVIAGILLAQGGRRPVPAPKT